MLEKINTLQYALSKIPGSGVDVPSGSFVYTFELILIELDCYHFLP